MFRDEALHVEQAVLEVADDRVVAVDEFLDFHVGDFAFVDLGGDEREFLRGLLIGFVHRVFDADDGLREALKARVNGASELFHFEGDRLCALFHRT